MPEDPDLLVELNPQEQTKKVLSPLLRIVTSRNDLLFNEVDNLFFEEVGLVASRQVNTMSSTSSADSSLKENINFRFYCIGKL